MLCGNEVLNEFNIAGTPKDSPAINGTYISGLSESKYCFPTSSAVKAEPIFAVLDILPDLTNNLAAGENNNKPEGSVKNPSIVPNPANGLLLSLEDLSINLFNLDLDSAALLSSINKCINSPYGAKSGLFNGL